MRERHQHTNLLRAKEAPQVPFQKKNGRRVPIPQVYILMTSRIQDRILLPRAQWRLTKYQPAEPPNDHPLLTSNEESTCGCSRSTSPAARAPRAAPTRRRTSQQARPSVTRIPQTAARKAIQQAPSMAPSSAQTAGLAFKRARCLAAERALVGGTLRHSSAWAVRRRPTSPSSAQGFCAPPPTNAQRVAAAVPAAHRAPAGAAPPAPPAPPGWAAPGPSPARTRRACIARRWRRRSSKAARSGCDSRDAASACGQVQPLCGKIGVRPSELI